MHDAPTPPDVADVLARGAVVTHFHAIASVRRRRLVAVEALSRGVAADGTLIPPLALFAAAAAQGLSVELDRHCRAAALARFAEVRAATPGLVCFVNLHAASVARGAAVVEEIVREAAAHGFEPGALAVEIPESHIEEVDALAEVVGALRAHGILVALDDIGAGHANLDRVVAVRPDIMKADRTLVTDLDRDAVRREVFTALVRLSERIGGWVVAEGIERRDEAIVALATGADLMQGFYFGRPAPGTATSVAGGWEERRVHEVAAAFATHTSASTRAARAAGARRAAITRLIADHLAGHPAAALDAGVRAIAAAAPPHPALVSLAVCDAGSGRQTTELAWLAPRLLPAKSLLYAAPERHADHSAKEWFYLLGAAGVDPYESPPYVPLPSAELCVTVSTRFHTSDGAACVLCAHFRLEDLVAVATEAPRADAPPVPPPRDPGASARSAAAERRA